MSAQFEIALDLTLKDEGGFVNKAADRGGATNMGITLASLSAWRKTPCSVEDIQNLTKDEAAKIYRAEFWTRMRMDQFKSQSIANAVFNIAVNCGPGRCAKFAQAAAGVKVDGIMGSGTIAAINAVDADVFLSKFVAGVRGYYNEIVAAHPEQQVFLKGWIARADRLIA